MTGKPKRSILRRGTQSTRYLCSSIARTVLISIIEKPAPMHLRGPALKGMYS
jgi:hypothetical protein